MAKSTAASDEQALNSLTQLFRLLSDKTRLQIVLLLAVGERNVTSLCEELKLPQPTVSHHLGLLRMNRVIVNKRHGKQVIYALESTGKASSGKLKFNSAPYSVTVEGF
jgi:DNA-binding transcriptional ArsR family regulator